MQRRLLLLMGSRNSIFRLVSLGQMSDNSSHIRRSGIIRGWNVQYKWFSGNNIMDITETDAKDTYFSKVAVKPSL